MTSHDELRDTLKTGDLVLFSGKSAFSATIRLVTGSRWSHVGMVMRLEEFEDAMLLLESSLLVDPRVLDIESAEAVQGVQLVPLCDRLSTYSGGSAMRRLEPALSDSMQAALDELRMELAHRPFRRRWASQEGGAPRQTGSSRPSRRTRTAQCRAAKTLPRKRPWRP